MKLSESFFLTRRENPNTEFTEASKLLVKSGLVLRNDNGIYSYLPMAIKVLNNIQKIIREELTKIHSEEVILPTLIRDKYDYESTFDEVFHVIDRNNNSMKLVHTSFEVFTDLVRQKVNSYKDLHFTLYQINNKYRDEKRLEYGLVRKREFLECEGYSFDSDEGGLDVSYDKMFLTFKNIFSRLSLSPMVVRTNDNDAIFSEEFQVISPNGDNKVVKCSNCGYTSNIEDASSKVVISRKEVVNKQRQLVKTDGYKTIKELSKFFNVFESNIIKSVIIKVDDIYKLALLRGNAELNINKLMKIYNTQNIEIPSVNDLEKLGIAVDYIGPVNCAMEIIADNEVKTMNNFICGSNKKNYYYKNVNIGRDFRISRYEDIKLFNENSLCPLCKSKCNILSGIEIGQINKLGNKPSKYYGISYTDEINQKGYAEIGSYYIGVDRCLNAIVENNHDEKGIIWPINIAPYKVAIVVSNMNHDKMCQEAEKLHKRLNSNGIETLYDDRKDSIGVKLNDMDLIGIPIRVTIGNQIDENMAEVKLRNKSEGKTLKIDKIYDYIDELIKEYNNK